MRLTSSVPLLVITLVMSAACSSGSGDGGPAQVATALAFGAAPATILMNGHFHTAPTVEIRDASGGVVTGSSATVTLHLLAGGGPGSLTGGTTATASGGVASFPTLSVSQPGTYTLVATASGLDSAVSAAFAVEALPVTATVEVGSAGGAIRFRSVRNGSINPAVDTIASGGSVTWSWVGDGHTVRATGGNFASSGIQNSGTQWVVNFIIPGTYQFDCLVHGTAMSGRIVVQ